MYLLGMIIFLRFFPSTVGALGYKSVHTFHAGVAMA
jgi:hypothetical protein